MLSETFFPKMAEAFRLVMIVVFILATGDKSRYVVYTLDGVESKFRYLVFFSRLNKLILSTVWKHKTEITIV